MEFIELQMQILELSVVIELSSVVDSAIVKEIARILSQEYADNVELSEIIEEALV